MIRPHPDNLSSEPANSSSPGNAAPSSKDGSQQVATGRLPRTHGAIEIVGPWLLNKGDELMLRSMIERLGDRFVLGSSNDIHRNGQQDVPELPRVKWQPTAEDFRAAVQRRSWQECASVAKRAAFLPFMSRRLLHSQKLLNGRDLVALLDCSGFAYGDQWTLRRPAMRADYYAKLRERGVKLIMLPQALGPFTSPESRALIRRMLDQFDLIFPREPVSEGHVLDLGVDPAKVAIYPDITHLLDGRPPPRPEEWHRRVAIVPNANMLEKTDAAVANRYLEFLVLCIERTRANDLEPFILLHEANDARLLDRLLGQIESPPPVVDEDGAACKGYLGACYANVGFRYHSLISSLGQGTPSLASSWSHKYEALFSTYGCPECLISPALEADTAAQHIDAFLQPERNEELRSLLRRRATEEKKKVEDMWQRVEAILPGHGRASAGGKTT